MPIAYSYTRFSSEKQAKGDSIRRQTALATDYIRTHPELELELSPMSLSDEGMSAYKGANAKRGALAAFMRAVEDEEVPSGSFLLIENFDRLSRQDPLTSIGQLTDLTKAGINVVTLVDEKIFSTETMKGVDGAWMLMSSIMTMARAHEESATKGKRVRAAWDNKKSKIEEGTHEQRLLSALVDSQVEVWPFSGPVDLIEEADGWIQRHRVNNWCYLGTQCSNRWADYLVGRLFKPEYEYKKAGIMLGDITPVGQYQADWLEPEQATDIRLMAALDGLNKRFGRGTVKVSTQGAHKEWQMRQERKSPNYTTDWKSIPTIG